jgi:hypothetical protein
MDEEKVGRGLGSGDRHRPSAGSRGRAPGGGQRAKPPMKVALFTRILQ